MSSSEIRAGRRVERRACWIEVVSRVSRYRGLLWYGNGVSNRGRDTIRAFPFFGTCRFPGRDCWTGVLEREVGGKDSIERVCEHRDGAYFVRLWLMPRHDFHPYNWMEFLKRSMRGNGIQVSREIYLIPTYTTFPRASDNYSRWENFHGFVGSDRIVVIDIFLIILHERKRIYILWFLWLIELDSTISLCVSQYPFCANNI